MTTTTPPTPSSDAAVRRWLVLGAGCALCALAAPAAHAQTDPAAPASQHAQAADDVVVTARRREENVQQVPIAISVVGGARLDALGTYNINRLTQLQPTLQFYSQNPRNTFINIRGIGAPFGLTNDGFEQGVGIYIDDVYYNRIASATLDFVDVERIETLRGPQGTLYGKNTTAGAINITTRAPSFAFEGRAEVSFGNLDFKQAKATVSGPLSERLAVRVSATTTERRGTVYDTASDSYIQSQHNIGVRAALLWRPTANLDVTLSGDWNLQNPNCCAFSFGRYGPTQRVANRQYPALIALFPGYRPPSTNPYDRVTDADAALRARNEHGGVSLRAVWELDASNTLTSITAWRYWDWDPANDRDYTGLPIYTKVNNPTDQNQYTQEFRFNHQGRGYDFVVGLFGFHQNIRTSGIQQTGPAASRWLLAPGSALSLNPAVLDNVVAINDIRLDNTSVAAFAKLNWQVVDRLTISPGIRVNYDDKDGLYNSVVTGTASNGTRQIVSPIAGSPSYTDPWTAAQRGIQSSQFFRPKYDAWNVSGDINLRYQLTGDVNVYATYARAFKTGGINLNGVPNRADGTPILEAGTIKPEKVNHFEVGLKSQFWGRRATFNLAGFWTDIKDFQANVSNGQFGTVRGYLANADKVRTRGVEADLSVRPSPRFVAYANGAFTDAEYVRFCDAPPPPELAGGPTTLPASASDRCAFVGTPGPAGVPGATSPPFVDASGQDLPGVSKWAFAWGAEGNLPGRILAQDGQFYLGYDASYRSRWSSNPTPSIYTYVDGYSIQNFRAGFRTDRFDAFAWVRNAFDRDYIDLLLAGTGGNTGLIAAQVGDPRTFGGTVNVRF